MSVGNQPSQASINNLLSSLSVQLRNVCDQIRIQNTYITQMGTNGLETLGYTQTDAQNIMTLMAYLNNISGVYYGTIQQGGSGGTGAIDFDFDNALSILWGGN